MFIAVYKDAKWSAVGALRSQGKQVTSDRQAVFYGRTAALMLPEGQSTAIFLGRVLP